MSNLATKDRDQLVQRVNELVPTDLMKWTPAEIVLMRERADANVNAHSFLAFVLTAARAGLNPIENDIYAIAYGGKTSIVTSIGGIRKTAQRTGRYLGMTEPTYYDDAGKEYAVWTGKGLPAACKVGAFVKDAPAPTFAVVLMREFSGTSPQWKQRPVHMLTKVAEAHAIRKVFAECGGLYEEAEADAIQGRKHVANEAGSIDIGKELADEPQPKPTPEIVGDVEPTTPPDDQQTPAPVVDIRKYLIELVADWSGLPAEDRAAAWVSAKPRLAKRLKVGKDWTDGNIMSAIEYVNDRMKEGADYTEWCSALPA